MGSSRRQLRAMLRKNWLLKIRHPFATCAEILLPTIVMLMLVGVRSGVDTQIHPVQAYIRKGMFVEVGNSEISPSFDDILKLMVVKGEHLAFAPDTNETRLMLDVLSLKFPLLKMVARIYKDELDLETYIRSDLYGVNDQDKNFSYPMIKGAVVFHTQGPQIFDYSIRLNHTWAFSGFPDVKTIMDVNGPYLDDLELGVNIVPTHQYGFSGFLTLQKVVDSLVILLAQQNGTHTTPENRALPLFHPYGIHSHINLPWTQYSPANISIAPFPTREYTDDEFQSIVKSVMGVLYLLGFLYPISRLISYSVFEKEQKIKEGLHMMGLKDEIFYLSWLITYSLQFAISSAIITICTMSSLFIYSDKSLVFVYFFFFGLSAVTLSFLISTFFSRAKTAVAVGTLSFLGAFFPYYSVNDPAVPMIWKILASLLSPTAFALGTVNFADYERAHVGVRWTNIWQASSGVNFLVCLSMMMLDMVLYCAIGLYLDKVLPRENGVHYPWNFLFTRQFWQRKKMFHHHADSLEHKLHDETLESKSHYAGKGTFEPSIEAASLDMKQQELDGRCICIRNLHKVYMTKKGKCCAVNSLQLTLFENQILALLGHNGAGKSTTISMLVGLLPPTFGDALVFGKNIRTDMDEIRKTLGVCPQNDILFPELTVKEHMEIFAILKGVEEDCLDRKVKNMIDEVGLADKVNTTVGALSGGMKRKLSLGIALIGNSKVIILDEPTSGMDPYSMRSTWQLIKKIKKGRIILLTTHSMDEADVLGDRIAIMANGQLRCCGSSLYLKHKYGVGYTLTMVKAAPGVSVAADIVHRHVPTATCLSDVGTEISFRLPLTSSSSFENMFREIESCIRRPHLSSEKCHSGYSEGNFGIESYGISVTTLEEVFLRVSGQNFDENDKSVYYASHTGSDTVVSEASHNTLIKPTNSKLPFQVQVFFIWICYSLGSTCRLIFSTVCSFIAFVTVKFCSCGLVTRSTFWEHSKALFIKRAISARRDRRTIVFQLFIPAVFLLFGLLFLKLKPHPDQYSMTLTTSYFNPLLRGGGGGPIPFNLSLPIAKKVASHVRGGWIQKQEPRTFRFPHSGRILADAIDAAGPDLGPALLSISEFLITSLNESYQSRYGAIVMNDQNDDGSVGYTVLHNSSCQHAAPTYINVMNAAILRLATGNKNMTIRTRNHPLPMTVSQRSQRHDLDAFSASIIVNIAFSFIPASFAVAIVKEREVKAKHQQLISGVSISSYWISTYVWDFISFLFPTSLAVILFFIFDLSQFIGNGCFVPTIVMFLEYGSAIAASTYCLTFFFSDHSVAQNVVLLVHFFSGLILMVISFLMGLIEATKEANSLLKNFFRLSPGFCFADGLASLALRRQEMKEGTGNDVLDWNVTGASICYLLLESIIYFLFTIGLELVPHQKLKVATIRESWHNFFSLRHDKTTSYTQPLLGSFDDSAISIVEEDMDVKAERYRILSGCVDNAIIYLQNLRKVYPARRNHAAKVAVHSLAFSVQEGECFGFLGTNGAGKTTTLSMLTGEEWPTGGTAYIFGNDIRLHPKAARRLIGYCPQFDALLEFLTAREHLELYARIKGVPEIGINDVVNEKLIEFDLCKHANKPSYSLSGGNKRKLSVAIAMIGNPPIVILDEPSTGMDPLAKRFMWDVISRLSTRRGKTAVILTTHSMNEAQALCTRIGIMVGGSLRCIGSPQHLKTRFGNHLELEVKPTEVSSIELDNLCKRIQESLFNFPSHTKSILSDLEICIGGSETIQTDSVSEISLTWEMIILIARMLGNEESIRTIVSSTPITDGVFGEQLSEQLTRDGGIPLRIFFEWWLAKEKFSLIDSFIISSFPGATFHGCNGLSVKYQLPYGEGSSLADIFGHLEHNREKLGIEEYSISQSTLETIFNHFAATQ
ncbi:ABC transporter A family member 1 [Phoenix dactylifera]|uniref:ABC transporter A family member 1 n=1 Tax=Phoenix dactylifera TaxID=42345 RepID=A0A8B9A9M3_PHODC|nr:ABC transporter A family member 1 [Phoenix dactylifera]